MMNLQELITRARFLFSRSPKGLEVFNLVNGKRSTKEIAEHTRRHISNVSRNLKQLVEYGLIQIRVDDSSKIIRKNGYPVYEKIPLARDSYLIKYFNGPATMPTVDGIQKTEYTKMKKSKRKKQLHIPSEKEILDICRYGEDQINEFKQKGTKPQKIAKEICAMLNTSRGGRIFYGIDDDGIIQGTDITRQRFDQQVQNSIRNTISPAPIITIKSKKVIGVEIIIVIVPPWNRKNVYQHDGRVLLRKGTNVFYASPEELNKLHKGEIVI